MKRLFTYILAVLLPLYLLFSLLWGRIGMDNRVCTGLYVSVTDSLRAQYITPEEVEESLEKHLKAIVQRPLSEINTDEIEHFLLENRLIKEVRCYITPSALLRVDISQRLPIMRVLGDSAAFFLDEHGGIMPGYLPQAVSVPVATGCISPDYARETLYPFALFLQQNDFWNAQIEQIYVADEKNVELVPRVGDHRILMGKLTHYEQKLQNLRCLYEQALPKSGWNAYTTISLKYRDQVVCTRRK